MHSGGESMIGSEGLVQPKQLQEVFDKLVEELYHWNGVAADEDRGRSNDGLVIALWDDGSGRVATHWGKDDQGHDVLNTQCEFDNVEQLVEWLSEYLGL